MMHSLTVALLAVPAAAQEAHEERTPVLRYEQLSFQSYLPRYVDINSLYEHANSFFGRMLEVDGRAVDNMTTLHDAILIYDTPENAARILDDLRRFDELLAPAGDFAAQSVTFEAMEYRPRGLSMDSLLQVLSPYQRSIEYRNSAGYFSFENISTVEETSMLLLRDTPEMLQEMHKLLERVDKPVPQVHLTCYVLRGHPVGTSNLNLPPADLQQSLSNMLPGITLGMEAVGILRSTTSAGHEIRFNMEGQMQTHIQDDGPFRRSYQLTLQTGAYDVASGTMNLEYCSFMFSDPYEGDQEVFNTSTAVRNNEYAVLGVVGAEPLFVVLQVRPLAQGPM